MTRKILGGLCGLTAIGCTGRETDRVTAPVPVPPTVTLIAVAPATATLPIGKWMTFSVVVNVPTGANKSVRWSSADSTKATVSPTGVVMGVAPATAVSICAASLYDNATRGCAALEVVP